MQYITLVLRGLTNYNDYQTFFAPLFVQFTVVSAARLCQTLVASNQCHQDIWRISTAQWYSGFAVRFIAADGANPIIDILLRPHPSLQTGYSIKVILTEADSHEFIINNRPIQEQIHGRRIRIESQFITERIRALATAFDDYQRRVFSSQPATQSVAPSYDSVGYPAAAPTTFGQSCPNTVETTTAQAVGYLTSAFPTQHIPQQRTIAITPAPGCSYTLPIETVTKTESPRKRGRHESATNH